MQIIHMHLTIMGWNFINKSCFVKTQILTNWLLEFGFFISGLPDNNKDDSPEK